MNDLLPHIYESYPLLLPEAVITTAMLITILLGLALRQHRHVHLILKSLALIAFGVSIVVVHHTPTQASILFGGMMRTDGFSSYFKILFLVGGILGTWMSGRQKENSSAEYFTLFYAIILGSCLLASSSNFIMVLLSLELISLSSYLLVGFGFDKKGAEGSLKYFLFGTVATACMIYGMSLIFGLAGTLDFSSDQFIKNLVAFSSPLLLIGGLLTLAGFLFKITAAPFHLWAPDVYESAPTPVVAFISVVPKLAGMAVLAKFSLAIHLFGHSGYNWQMIIAVVSILSILIGNLSAIAQTNPKRMLAYSSVAQAGFMLIGIVTFDIEGIHFMLFYSAVFLVMNFLVFHALNQFEHAWGANDIKSLAGRGTASLIPSLALLMGLISLTGLPPTAGFTAKLFIFGSLWDAFRQSSDPILLALFVIGLLNTVVSLFFYLKIPYYLFIKEKKENRDPIKTDFASNLLSLILVILLFYLFVSPGGLMGWINKISFVL